ncbi:nucleotidyltransferase family protein [Flammeovirga aprica]|uniref:RelA/SpoT domain-containing protein n=1 Tax=Flammeovirga aprica JL-4 TaxID=694437 RepID=A0A7X9XDG3_9BACT|nr:hypothetical protein [Flammeovirga aprica]NME72614.1 hypothetical protein [Flammeovirga aprica JL-4]
MTQAISKSKVKKTGRKIRKELKESNTISKDNLECLQHYRLQHIPALKICFDYLVRKGKNEEKGSLVVFRLKRIDTIKRKIIRFPNMDLSTMQDIAGCRIILNQEKSIYRIVKEFEGNKDFSILKSNDYIKEPSETGYSSYHLIVKHHSCDSPVEIQLRTRTQHYWATFVELLDVVYKEKVKEGSSNPKLQKFHYLMSLTRDNKKLTTRDLEFLLEYEKEKKIIKKSIEIFGGNLGLSLKKWLESENNKEYLLLILDRKLNPTFNFFDDYQKAENSYLENFSSSEPNMVLIHSNNLEFDKIQLAYSNYILTNHPAIIHLLNLHLEKYNEFKINTNMKMFIKYYEYMRELIETFQSKIDVELEELSKYLSKNEDKLSYDVKFIIEKWLNSLTKRYQLHQSLFKIIENDYKKYSNFKEKISKKTTLQKILYRLHS